MIKNIHIEDKGFVETFDIYRGFGKEEEFGTVTLGKSNCEVSFTLRGNKRYYYYDEEKDDMVFAYEESIDPSEITLPIATLLDVNMYHRFKVGFSPEGVSEDVTSLYKVNENGEIVLIQGQE